MNLLQTTLDYQSSLVNFEAVQQAPPLGAGETVGVQGANIVLLPPPTPRGIFRPGAARDSNKDLTISRLDEFHADRRTDFDGVSGRREPSRLLVDPEDDD